MDSMMGKNDAPDFGALRQQQQESSRRAIPKLITLGHDGLGRDPQPDAKALERMRQRLIRGESTLHYFGRRSGTRVRKAIRANPGLLATDRYSDVVVVEVRLHDRIPRGPGERNKQKGGNKTRPGTMVRVGWLG